MYAGLQCHVNAHLNFVAAHRKSTLVFCVNLTHLRDLTNTFREAGVDARYIYASTPAPERQALINGFKEGQFPVLLNVGTLPTEMFVNRQHILLQLY